MKKTGRRLSRGYDGTVVTNRRFSEVLPSVLASIHKSHEERHDLVLASWPQIIGPKIAKFTSPESFSEGILKVKVSNSTLYSLLNQSEKAKILLALRQKFPKVEIKKISFRMG